jgi:hypothetical protein
MVARETPDSFTTSSIVVLPMPKRATQAYADSSNRSRSAGSVLATAGP